MFHRIFRKQFLTLSVLPFVLLLVGAKWVIVSFGFDIMPMSPLVAAMVSANVFLLGFLISGLLPDYKEAEKIPGEISASLDVLADENLIIWKQKQAPEAKAFLEHIALLAGNLDDWFHKKERTQAIMAEIRACNTHFAAMETLTQANFITRLKQEQNTIRKAVIRVHSIRETTFIATAYAIAESFTFLVVLLLLIVQIGPLGESLFFVGMISFLLIYMIGLIKDLDNPFHYHENRHLDDEIAVEPIRLVKQKIDQELAKMEK
jgi:predicted membrane chloride channel (bestrophin family)